MIRTDEKVDTRNIERLYEALEQDSNSDLILTKNFLRILGSFLR